MSVWRPIHTAPRDGTRIIIFNPNWEGAFIARWGWFERQFHDEVPSASYWLLDSDDYEIGGVGGLVGYESQKEEGLTPTHWAPLPPEQTLEEVALAQKEEERWLVYDKAIRRHDRRAAAAQQQDEED